MSITKDRQALSDRLLELAESEPSTLKRDALQAASKYLLSGVPVPMDIAEIVQSTLSFNQNRWGQ